MDFSLRWMDAGGAGRVGPQQGASRGYQKDGSGGCGELAGPQQGPNELRRDHAIAVQPSFVDPFVVVHIHTRRVVNTEFHIGVRPLLVPSHRYQTVDNSESRL